MVESRKKKIFRNVAPAILSNACVFLFSVVDGIFVGNGAGSQALGAVNIALPFVLLTQALNAMASIGGVTITAIRFGYFSEGFPRLSRSFRRLSPRFA